MQPLAPTHQKTKETHYLCFFTEILEPYYNIFSNQELLHAVQHGKPTVADPGSVHKMLQTLIRTYSFELQIISEHHQFFRLENVLNTNFETKQKLHFWTAAGQSVTSILCKDCRKNG